MAVCYMAAAAAALLLLLWTTTTITSATAFVSKDIDCGSSRPITDGDLYWSGDSYLQMISGNGVSRYVSPTMSSGSAVMDTLRVFPDFNRKKNCYSFSAEKGDRLLVRASFYYGNYDSKLSPPAFDLLLDAWRWGRVQTSMDTVVTKEVIYVAGGDTVSVCLAQVFPDQFPFINALQARSLKDAMYSYMDPKKPLFLQARFAFGASEPIRYFDDLHDRIWEPTAAMYVSVGNEAIFVDTSSAVDDPPRAVFRNATTTASTSTPLNLSLLELPPSDDGTGTNLQINMYFSEVTELSSDELRSFRLHINGVAVSDPILPPYREALEVNVSKLVVSSNSNGSSSSSVFSLVATPESTLPPLINAIEVFQIGDADLPINGTNSRDVDGLAALQFAFGSSLRDWSGDPCLPAPYSWDWIHCTTDPIPRVTALNLSSHELSGTLPDLSSMDALETIDLHNNSILGRIPETLGMLPNLKELNLANNKLSGSVPASLTNKKGLKMILAGNPNLICPSGMSCGGGSTTSSGSGTPWTYYWEKTEEEKKGINVVALIIGIAMVSFTVVWAIVGVCLLTCSSKRKSNAVRKQQLQSL